MPAVESVGCISLADLADSFCMEDSDLLAFVRNNEPHAGIFGATCYVGTVGRWKQFEKEYLEMEGRDSNRVIHFLGPVFDRVGLHGLVSTVMETFVGVQFIFSQRWKDKASVNEFFGSYIANGKEPRGWGFYSDPSLILLHAMSR
jgi:hypothetical protein